MASEAHVVPFRNPLARIWNENHRRQGPPRASRRASWREGHSGTERLWPRRDCRAGSWVHQRRAGAKPEAAGTAAFHLWERQRSPAKGLRRNEASLPPGPGRHPPSRTTSIHRPGRSGWAAWGGLEPDARSLRTSPKPRGRSARPPADPPRSGSKNDAVQLPTEGP